ncbi:unnamed protein product [Lactuca virosa]|uniref:Uncharacterized protein n=1 Tax=Lactuca virosa TaxID=75947 RepID=A0AAU9MJE0_9ASTR|nr:unnamed protein product [Lactuca virosa]
MLMGLKKTNDKVNYIGFSWKLIRQNTRYLLKVNYQRDLCTSGALLPIGLIPFLRFPAKGREDFELGSLVGLKSSIIWCRAAVGGTSEDRGKAPA